MLVAVEKEGNSSVRRIRYGHPAATPESDGRLLPHPAFQNTGDTVAVQELQIVETVVVIDDASICRPVCSAAGRLENLAT